MGTKDYGAKLGKPEGKQRDGTTRSQPGTSQALESLMRQSFTTRSSATEATSGIVGWKHAQFTPRLWPSITCLTSQWMAAA